MQRKDAELVVLGRNGVGVSLPADAPSVDCATVQPRPQCGALAVTTREVGSEDEDRIGGRQDLHLRTPGCCRSPRAVWLPMDVTAAIMMVSLDLVDCLSLNH